MGLIQERNHAFHMIVEECQKVALARGKPDPSGFSHAFLWITAEVGKYKRDLLVTASENFLNWREVQDEVLKVPGVLSTRINWD